MDKIVYQTKEFYNNYYKKYFEETKNVVVPRLIDSFLKYIKFNERILDLGCGSGNYLKQFTLKGYKAIGIDYSEKLCRLAREFSKTNVCCLDFSKVDSLNEFILKNNIQHIFANASLLHLSRIDFYNFINNVNIRGIMFFSLKEGAEECINNDNRFFTYYNKLEVEKIIKSKFKILLFFYTKDEFNRKHSWLNWVVRSH